LQSRQLRARARANSHSHFGHSRRRRSIHPHPSGNTRQVGGQSCDPFDRDSSRRTLRLSGGARWLRRPLGREDADRIHWRPMISPYVDTDEYPLVILNSAEEAVEKLDRVRKLTITLVLSETFTSPAC